MRWGSNNKAINYIQINISLFFTEGIHPGFILQWFERPYAAEAKFRPFKLSVIEIISFSGSPTLRFEIVCSFNELISLIKSHLVESLAARMLLKSKGGR